MAWPEGVGGMAERVLRHDWAASPLGPIGSWSAELRVAAMIVLDARLPSVLFWGPERPALFNDAFAALTGIASEALGRPLAQSWPEGWARLEPLVASAFRGEAAGSDEMTVEVGGAGGPRRLHLSSNHNPVRDLDNRVVGAIATVLDRTGEVLAADALRASEDRLGFLLALSDALRPIEEKRRVLDAGLRLVADRLGISRAVLCELDSDGDTVRSVEAPIAERWPLLRGRRLSDLGLALATTLRAGRAVAVGDADADERLGEDARSMLRTLGTRSFVAVPLFRQGLLRAFLYFDRDRPTAWSEPEVRVVEAAGERIWAASERAATRGSLRQFAMLMESSHEFIAIFDMSLMPSYVNAAGLRMTGLPDMATAASLPLPTFLLPDDAALVRDEILPRVKAQGAAEVEFRLRRFSGGEPLWAICSLVLLTDEEGMARGYGLVARDITDRKRAEVALRESEERLLRFGEASSDVLWIREAEGLQWTYLTAAFETVYGVARERVLLGDNFRNWASLVVEEDREHAVSHIDLVRRGEQVSFEYRVRRPGDGAIRWVRNTDFPIRDAAGDVRSIGGISQDVTELRSAQEALAEAGRRQRVLVEGIPQLLWRAAPGGRWTWASPQWVEYTGLSLADSLGFGWLAALHPDDRERARRDWDGVAGADALDMETRLRSAREGRYRWFSTRALPVRDADGAVLEWLGTSTDIDDLRQLQDEQRVLVAELQHRTRNLIGVIRSIAEQTMARTGPTERFRLAFRDRLAALSRVQGLLSESGERKVTIGDVVRLELDALGAAETGRVAAEGEPVPLRKSMVQTLALAVHELATNARKYGALSQEGGRLRIRWMTVRNEDGETRLRLDWTESGVDMRCARDDGTAGGGYGRELIERALPYALKARTRYELAEDGLRCTIDLPLGTGSRR